MREAISRIKYRDIFTLLLASFTQISLYSSTLHASQLAIRDGEDISDFSAQADGEYQARDRRWRPAWQGKWHRRAREALADIE